MITIETLDPFTLPSVALDDIRNLPSSPGFYFALTDTILYIGIAGNLAQRWRYHHRLAQLQAITDVRIAWLELGVSAKHRRRDMERIEQAFIRRFKPTLNDTLLPTEYKKDLRIILKFDDDSDAARYITKTAQAMGVSHSTIARMLLHIYMQRNP